ncbi:MAG: hypothetical protein RL346_294 [Verrucomicrobiota bacterium]
MNRIPMNRLSCSIAMMLISLLPLCAQTVAEVSPPVGNRIAWFVQTAIPDGMENPVKVMTGRKIELITLSNRLASGPVNIPPDGVIRLVREIPDPTDPVKTSYLNLAEATIPETMNQALILLVPAAADPPSSRMFHTKAIGLSDFKGGDSLYLNLTHLNLMVEIGEDKIPLKPGNMRIRHDRAAAAADVPFRYSYHDPAQEKWRVLSASVTIMSPTRREIVVFGVDQKNVRVKCNHITFPVRNPEP